MGEAGGMEGRSGCRLPSSAQDISQKDGAREQDLGRIRLLRHGEAERGRRRCGPEKDMEGNMVT